MDSLAFSKEFNKKVTYHDPCFLGKQNEIYDEPRNIIQAVPGIDLLNSTATAKAVSAAKAAAAGCG